MPREFTVTNATGYTILRVYLSPSEDPSWEDDLLGDQTLGDGEMANIVLNREHPAETWDLKVQFDDAEEDVWSALSINGANNIVLSYDDDDGALADVQ